MRSPIAIAWLLLAALPAAGAAQEMPGLDLSAPPKPKPPPKQPASSPEGEELPPVNLSAPPAKPAAAPAQAVSPLGPSGERDAALGDRVKAVQRKGFLKRNRLDLTPLFAVTVNDAFYAKFGGGLRLAYNLEDSFAVATRWVYFEPYRTDSVREGKVAFNSQLLTSQVYGQLMLDGIWSPIYGKAAVIGRSIVHFDLFLLAGFGAVRTATSVAPRNEGDHLAADLGAGLRFYPREWLAFELGLTATFYPDQPISSVPGTIQKVVVANVGVSIFWPFGFDYYYP
ncbi:MAG TPA: outer membrane beta-barrel domain-containing protein [Anaeromyxobacteraceae bacterium]|nr:outer membrane beta-barrel domain-containing protein [Anaeromyxobacteraceae bacterium]